MWSLLDLAQITLQAELPPSQKRPQYFSRPSADKLYHVIFFTQKTRTHIFSWSPKNFVTYTYFYIISEYYERKKSFFFKLTIQEI